MKNKKALAVLIALAIIQLIFPVSLFVYQSVTEQNIIEQGKKYTLNYTEISHFTKEKIGVDTDEIYSVKWYDPDIDEYVHDAAICLYSKVRVEEKADGSLEFFDAEEGTEDNRFTDYNWFISHEVFNFDIDDFEFVVDEFGMKELYDLSFYLSEEKPKELTYEEFMTSKDGYYTGLWNIPIEGKITLCVYKGHAEISELYIGDELIMKHK